MSRDSIQNLLEFVVFAILTVGGYWMLWTVFRVVRGRNRNQTEEEFDAQFTRLKVCTHCGYDLRASPERCPECGSDVATMESERTGSVLDAHLLRDDWPEADVAPRIPEPYEVPIPVLETQNSMEADLLVQQLMVRGVFARRETTEAKGLAGRISGSNYFVIVSEKDEANARAIVDRFRYKTLSPRMHANPSANGRE